MKTFQELTVSGEPEKVRAFFDKVSTTPGRWSRDVDAEQRLGGLGPPTLCFDTPPDSGLPASGVFLMEQRDASSVRVANVVPTEKRSLSHDEYNTVLEVFHEEVVKPSATELGLTISLSAPTVDVAEYLSPWSARLLKDFSVCANRSTGAAQPADKERWLAFLVASAKEPHPLPAGLLRRWFLEEAAWPDVDVVDNLVHDYALALDLHSASQAVA